MDGKPSQTFKVGEAFLETANLVHNLRNASAAEPARALGFQYAGKGQLLQVNAPYAKFPTFALWRHVEHAELPQFRAHPNATRREADNPTSCLKR
jgi:hypothetical protein